MSEPKLRFKADDGSEFPKLKEMRLGEITKPIHRKADKNSMAPVMMISQGNGFIYQAEKYSRENAGQSLKNYTLLRRGEMAYNHGASKAKPYGVTYALTEENEARVPYVYHCFSLKGEEKGAFWNYALNTACMDRQLKKMVSSGVRMDGLLNITYNSYMDVKISHPIPEEQRKIAEFFETLDEVIFDTQAEVAVWEKQKRGVMQLLFSRKVRFKADDGSEFPEWRGKTLGDVSCITMGQSPDSSSYNDAGDGVLLVQGNADIQDKKTTPTRWTSKPTKFADSGDIIMSVRAPVGTIGIATTRVCCGRGVCAIKANVNTSQSYLYQYLVSIEKKWDKEAQGGTFTAISGNDIRARKVPVPCLAEQQKIAACLSAFDDVIDKTKEELDAYRELKKGLLQQMFV